MSFFHTLPLAETPLFLTGMRASGKSTLGPLLAHELALAFVDLDVLICEEQGRSVGEIVANDGWEAFRNLESQALERCARPGTLIATGGGVILRPENRELMRQRGAVIYLQAMPQLLWQRLQADPKRAQRPSLGGTNPYARPESSVSGLEEIKAILEERRAAYEESAHMILDAALPLDQLCAAVLAALPRSRRPA